MNAIPEELAQQIRNKLNSNELRLPSLPDTIIKVQQLMATEDYSAADLARILEGDAAFATAVTRIANSAAFNTSGKPIRNINTAIQRIGMGNLLKLLISIASRHFFNVKNSQLRTCMQKVQNHSLLVSAISESIAATTQHANPADTFLASLLHDQGKGVLVTCIPDELLTLSEAQRLNVCSAFHREMGARLLHKWKLPDDIILVAQHHGIESPDRPSLPMLDCIDVADFIAHSIEEGASPESIDLSGSAAGRRLRLTDTQMAGILMDVEDKLEELQQAFAA